MPLHPTLPLLPGQNRYDNFVVRQEVMTIERWVPQILKIGYETYNYCFVIKGSSPLDSIVQHYGSYYFLDNCYYLDNPIDLLPNNFSHTKTDNCAPTEIGKSCLSSLLNFLRLPLSQKELFTSHYNALLPAHDSLNCNSLDYWKISQGDTIWGLMNSAGEIFCFSQALSKTDFSLEHIEQIKHNLSKDNDCLNRIYEIYSSHQELIKTIKPKLKIPELYKL